MLGVALAGIVTPRRGRAQDTSGPTAPIQALNDGLIAVMRAGKATPFRDRFHMLTPTVDRAFDLPGILRVSVGLRWDDVDAAQQAILLKVFRGFTVVSYVANFDSMTANDSRLHRHCAPLAPTRWSIRSSCQPPATPTASTM